MINARFSKLGGFFIKNPDYQVSIVEKGVFDIKKDCLYEKIFNIKEEFLGTLNIKHTFEAISIDDASSGVIFRALSTLDKDRRSIEMNNIVGDNVVYFPIQSPIENVFTDVFRDYICGIKERADLDKVLTNLNRYTMITIGFYDEHKNQIAKLDIPMFDVFPTEV